MTQRSAVGATPTSGLDPDLCVWVLGALLQDGTEQCVPQGQFAGVVPEVESGPVHDVGEADAGLRVGEPPAPGVPNAWSAEAPNRKLGNGFTYPSEKMEFSRRTTSSSPSVGGVAGRVNASKVDGRRPRP